MTNKQYRLCVAEAENYTDREAYISDLALSSVWSDAADAEIPDERIRALGEIWDACNRSVKQIAAEAGISCRAMAERFCIPYRTMEDWSGGHHDSPLYMRLMMQELLGLLHR